MAETEKTVAAEDVAEKDEQVKDLTEKLGGRAALAEKFGKATIELSKPFSWCGQTYEKVEMDFEGLTGRDMEAIDDEIGMNGLRGVVPAYSRIYQRLLAAHASGVPADAIQAMPLVDYNAIVRAAEYFLIVTG
jgi:hypothetical protein